MLPRVHVSDGDITVEHLLEGFAAIYYKAANEPQLILNDKGAAMRPIYMVPLLLVGCTTPAAKPEIAVSKPPETVQTCVTQGLVARGWRVRSNNPGQVIFSKRAGPTLGIDAPYGSVATLLFVPGKVITDVEMVTNIDSGGEEPFVDGRPDKTDVESAVVLCR
ncbi:MAG: hypothetical protein WBF11_02455 [Methyloceanibacter sp.]